LIQWVPEGIKKRLYDGSCSVHKKLATSKRTDNKHENDSRDVSTAGVFRGPHTQTHAEFGSPKETLKNWTSRTADLTTQGGEI